MSPFRRRPRRGQARDDLPVDSTVAFAVPLAGGSAAEAGTDSVVRGVPISPTHYELQAIGAGLIIAPQTGSRVPVPALVPWSEVCSVGITGMAELADRSCGEVLEIEVSDGGWFIGDRVQRFVAPPSSLEPLVLAASSYRPLTHEESVEPESPPGRWAGLVCGPACDSTRSAPGGRASRPRAVAGLTTASGAGGSDRSWSASWRSSSSPAAPVRRSARRPVARPGGSRPTS